MHNQSGQNIIFDLQRTLGINIASYINLITTKDMQREVDFQYYMSMGFENLLTLNKAVFQRNSASKVKAHAK